MVSSNASSAICYKTLHLSNRGLTKWLFEHKPQLYSIFVGGGTLPLLPPTFPKLLCILTCWPSYVSAAIRGRLEKNKANVVNDSQYFFEYTVEHFFQPNINECTSEFNWLNRCYTYYSSCLEHVVCCVLLFRLAWKCKPDFVERPTKTAFSVTTKEM